MGNQITSYSEDLYEYRLRSSSSLGAAWNELAQETDRLPNAQMRSSDDVGLMLRTLARSIGAKRAIDVGTFTGASALALGLGMSDEGKVISFDVLDTHVELARKHWAQAGLESQIEFRCEDATKALERLAETEQESFDIVFIDANKKAYGQVWESALKLVRPQGYVIADDTLWSGKIIDEACDDKQLPSLRAFNEAVANDRRVEAVVLPIGNGLTIALKL